MVALFILFIWGRGPPDFPSRGSDGDVWGLPLWGHGHVTGTCTLVRPIRLGCAAAAQLAGKPRRALRWPLGTPSGEF